VSEKINIIFVYISEAHAVDVWNIGLSAGVINHKHKTISDSSLISYKTRSPNEVWRPSFIGN
jgi:hypothetical protein